MSASFPVQENRIEELLQFTIPLPSDISEMKANCFNAVMVYHKPNTKLTFCPPEDFVSYIQGHFAQVETLSHLHRGDVLIVWSRSVPELEYKKVDLNQMKKDIPGYPFNLVIEHSMVLLDNEIVFQKRDPTEDGPYEQIELSQTLAPYQERTGLEVTYHKKL